MKTYKDVYQFPLEESHGWIYDQKGNFVFQFMIDDEKVEQKTLDVINGKENFKNPDLVFKHERGQIVDKSGLPIILIRGWGNLTGTGAMNLSDEEASNIQDTFADFIVERLNFREDTKTKAICEKCEKDVEEVCMCERCEEMMCEDCSAEYNQFTQIDYNCCKGCANQD